MLHAALMTVILYDDDIRSRLDARDAVRWMGEAIDANYCGDLVAPPRVHADLGDGRIVFTTGRLRGSWFGYRSYDTFPTEPGSQLVAVHDESSGEMRDIAIGNELGPRRTGAIGEVAAEALASPTATIAALIGTGTQALTQLWALSTVRDLTQVRCSPATQPGEKSSPSWRSVCTAWCATLRQPLVMPSTARRSSFSPPTARHQ